MKRLLKILIESIVREEIEEQFFMSFGSFDKERNRDRSSGNRTLHSYADQYDSYGGTGSGGYDYDYGYGSWGRYERDYNEARDEARLAAAEREALSEPVHSHESDHADTND